MSRRKLLETAQLTLADLDLHLIQDLSHLLRRDSELFSNFKTYGTGKLPILGLCLNGLLYSLRIHPIPPIVCPNVKAQINDELQIPKKSVGPVI
jgi:hypothetical protein